jgi:hypothetical protein
MSTIREYIQKIAEGGKTGRGEMYSIIAKVTNVDASDYTCDVEPIDTGIELLGVKLHSGIGSAKSIVIIPKVGSHVVCTFINKSQAYVSLCDEADKVEVKSSTESLNDVLKDLITAIEQMTVTTGVGPSGVPINLTQFTAIKNRLTKLFKS